MNNIISVFENCEIQIIIDNDAPLFEMYSTGMALGYITNSKGVKISKEEFDILYKYYSISEIDSMDSEAVKENVANLKKHNSKDDI